MYLAYPKYTKTRWTEVGSIPFGWEARRLKFAATCNDEALPETTDPDYEIAYVDISSVDLVNGITAVETHSFDEAPSRARRIVRDGDTIVSTVRTYLKAIAPIESPPDNMIVSTGFAVIRPLESVNSRFLGYALQNTAFIDDVVANSIGVSYPAINPTTLVCLPVSYPEDKTEQQQIAAFLDWKTVQIDALIAKKKELLEKLKEKRLAVITQAVTKGLPSTGSGQAATPLRDSGIPWLGLVPKHWEVKRLKFYVERVYTGSTPPSDESQYYDEPAMIWFTPSDFSDEGAILSGSKRKLNIVAANDGVVRFFEQPCALIVGIGATLGRVGFSKGSFSCNQQINVIVPAEGMDAKFLFYSLSVKRETMKVISNATTLGILNQETTRQIEISAPTIDEQNKIVAFLDKEVQRTDSLMLKVEAAIARLTEYRTALITAATTGKIDVRQVAVPIPAQTSGQTMPLSGTIKK